MSVIDLFGFKDQQGVREKVIDLFDLYLLDRSLSMLE